MNFQFENESAEVNLLQKWHSVNILSDLGAKMCDICSKEILFASLIVMLSI